MTTQAAFGLDLDSPLDAALSTGLEAVEALMRDTVRSGDEFVSEAAGHLVAAGGKRFRPLVTLLSARFGDPSSAGVVPAAVVVELTHLATLYHDDVMDEAELRRGADSANSRWGNSIAILTGDYLFARASDLLADLGPDAVRLQARTFERLVHGQIHETRGPQGGEDPVEHYLRVLGDKTGSLIGTAARFGAMLAGAPADEVDVLTRWGEQIGIAFQLSDDLLDVASESTESGKVPGTDLREHVPTLPVLLLRSSADPADAGVLGRLDADLSDDRRLADALTALREHPVMEQAQRVTAEWAQRARDTVAPLPEGAARRALESLSSYVVGRAR